ncbi:hypothetical protein UY3_08097, partial [Chelonia mydas]
EFLFCHPTPCSLVISSVNEKERQGQKASVPKAKETKRLDLFGRKVYSSGGLQRRIANQQAILNRHNLNSWMAMSKFKDRLPQDTYSKFATLIEEGKAVVKTLLQASLDLANSAARTIASGDSHVMLSVATGVWPPSRGPEHPLTSPSRVRAFSLSKLTPGCMALRTLGPP